MKENIIISVKDAMSFDRVLELDFNKFIVLNVGTVNLEESNLFLNSLWRECNLELSPKELDRCPWAYFPKKITTKKYNISYFGSMRTKIGIIHVAISYKIKGRIDNLHFFSENVDLYSNKALFKSIIRKAKKNINVKFKYLVKCRLVGKYESTGYILSLNDYSTDFFRTYVEDGVSYIEFVLDAQDLLDGYKNANIKLKLITNFLAVETNIYFKYSNINIIEKENDEIEKNIYVNNIYQEDIHIDDLDCEGDKFVDFYVSINQKVLLSKKGIGFIDKIISNNKEVDDLNIFLNSCYHFRQGLEREYDLDTQNYEIYSDCIIKVSNINQTEVGCRIDGALTHYLSAIETVTLINYEPQKCQICGQLKFKINKRVYDFINTYVSENHGDIFKKLYNLRSKYLHIGEEYTSYNNNHVRPLLDNKTATGCKEYDFISINIDGNIIGFGVSNIREWTSHALRNFYKQIF